jgi:GNAT superfamily N-acetyltransferase
MGGVKTEITIRNLRADDCARLVKMDAQITGRTREVWFEGKLRRALRDSDLHISLGAEVDGHLVGAMLGSLHYGEFGLPEPIAVLDTVLVDRAFQRRGIATTMMRQFVKNLRGLRIERLRTEVGWDEHELVGFFARAGFAPIPSLVLEMDLTRAQEALAEEDEAAL